MAKMVECLVGQAKAVLEEHGRDWRLVAVIARTQRVASTATAINPRYEEVRELYFERLDR